MREEDQKNEKVEEEKTASEPTESSPVNSDPDPKSEETNISEVTPTTNGDVNASENSIDCTTNTAVKNNTNENESSEPNVENANPVNQTEDPMEEENRENESLKINKKIKQEKGEMSAVDDLYTV